MAPNSSYKRQAYHLGALCQELGSHFFIIPQGAKAPELTKQAQELLIQAGMTSQESVTFVVRGRNKELAR